MKQSKGKPRMPSDHVPIEREMRAFRAKDPCLSDSELKRKVLELRNLPTDPNDPYWKELNRRKSYKGKFRQNGEHIKDLFIQAFKGLGEDSH